MSAVLKVADISQRFGAATVLQGVSFTLEAGERLAILGASGSGKTTLLRLIAGLEAPYAGEIHIDDKLVSSAARLIVPPEHRQVAMVFQGLALFPHLRALEQITFAARGHGGEPSARKLLERVGLGHRGTARLDELSGGERQRIALARALAQEPRLLLMDEPFASLDDQKRAEMRDLLRSLLAATQTTLVLVTHSRDDALNLARRVLILDGGRQRTFDLLENVLVAPRHPADVRALGLGQIVEATLDADEHDQTGDVAASVFGLVRIAAASSLRGRAPLRVRLHVRPDQPRISVDGPGVAVEVVSTELRPPELRRIRRVAVVRAGDQLLRVFTRDATYRAGQRVNLIIEDECDVLEVTETADVSAPAAARR